MPSAAQPLERALEEAAASFVADALCGAGPEGEDPGAAARLAAAVAAAVSRAAGGDPALLWGGGGPPAAELLRTELADVDWEEVALAAGLGPLEGGDLGLLSLGRLMPEQRRARERAREEALSAALLRATAKPCPGRLPGGGACGAPCQRAEGCNTVACSACRAAWCWRCGAVKAYRGVPGERPETIVNGAHELDAADPRCACAHFQRDDDAAAAPAGYDPARAEAFNAAEARGLRGGRPAAEEPAEVGGGLAGRAERLQDRIVLAARLRSCHERPQAEAEAQLARLAQARRHIRFPIAVHP
jgi:hypothetical protein